MSWYSNLCRSIFTRIFSLLSITGYGEIYEVSRISRSQAEVVDNTNTLAQRRAVMTARTFYQCGQCLNLRSCTMILTLSLLLVLVPSLKREVFLRLLSIFILLRNQYVLIQIRCRMLDIESHLGCTTSFFKIISTTESFFSLANILLKQSKTLQCLFCLLAGLFSIQLFAKSSSPSV